MNRIYLIDDKRVTQQQYLYGINEEVPEIPEDIVRGRVSILNYNLGKLLEVDLEKRDSIRINKIIKAIRFWGNINNEESQDD